MYSTGEWVVGAAEREPEDAQLVRAVLAGDTAAFDTLLDRHSGPVTSVVHRFLDDPNELEDAVQETFIRAFQNLRRFRGDASLRTWLVRIAINICRDRRRGAWRRRIVLTDDAPRLAEEQRPPQAGGPPDAAALRQVLEDAVRRLPEHLRIPFTLHVLEELSGAEVAVVLGCRESLVWSRIYAARRVLQRELAPDVER